jgi:hypothetical protein
MKTKMEVSFHVSFVTWCGEASRLTDHDKLCMHTYATTEKTMHSDIEKF